MNVLNIPIDVIKSYKTSKARRELLAFAIAIKCAHSNSVLIDVSIRKIMGLFHVSFNKAKRLLEEAKDCPLFTYDEHHNQLRANTLKDKSEKVSKTGIRYKSDYCYKLDKANYTIQSLCQILSNILIKNAIHAVQMDKLLKSGNNSTKKKPCAYKKGLNQRRLSSIAGISLSSVSRSLKRMWQNNEIDRTSAHAKLVISSVNDDTVKEWNERTCSRPFIYNPKDNSGWLFFPTEYTLKDVKAKFLHVIYSHAKRLTFNVSRSIESDIDRFYSTIHAF